MSSEVIMFIMWIFRSFIYLFDQLEKRKDDATFVIKASYLEIYNEKVG